MICVEMNWLNIFKSLDNSGQKVAGAPEDCRALNGPVG